MRGLLGMIIGAAIDRRDGDSGIKGAAVQSGTRVLVPLAATTTAGWIIYKGTRRLTAAGTEIKQLSTPARGAPPERRMTTLPSVPQTAGAISAAAATHARRRAGCDGARRRVGRPAGSTASWPRFGRQSGAGIGAAIGLGSAPLLRRCSGRAGNRVQQRRRSRPNPPALATPDRSPLSHPGNPLARGSRA